MCWEQDSRSPSKSRPRRKTSRTDNGLAESESVRLIGSQDSVQAVFDTFTSMQPSLVSSLNPTAASSSSATDAAVVESIPSMGTIPALADGVDNVFNIMCGGRSGAKFLRHLWQHREASSLRQQAEVQDQGMCLVVLLSVAARLYSSVADASAWL